MKWISLTEQRPQAGECVLAFWPPKGGDVHPGCFSTAVFTGEYWHNHENEDDDYAEPTHWMPLPDAPQGEQQ